MTRLYKADGTQAGLKEVVEWFNRFYPERIFITHPIAKIRDMLNELMNNDTR